MQIKVLNPNVNIPEQATDGSAGFDLQAAINEKIILSPGQTQLIPTGLAIFIEDKSLVGILVPRSKKGTQEGLVLANLVGIIDSDYQGEYFISVWNRNLHQNVVINPYEKIAQILFLKLADTIKFEIVNEFTKQTSRADGGISKTINTGKKL